MGTATLTHKFNDVDNFNIIGYPSSNTTEVAVQAMNLEGQDEGNTNTKKHYKLTFNIPNVDVELASHVSFSTGDPETGQTASNPPDGKAPSDGGHLYTYGLTFSSYHEVERKNVVNVWFTADNYKTGACISFVREITVNYGDHNVVDNSGSCITSQWSPPAPPAGCPYLPSPRPGGDGELLLTKNGANGVTVNLENYPNQLVTLELMGTFGGSSWSNTCKVTAPNSSDIVVDGQHQPGVPYSLPYYESSHSFNAKIYNIDGGSSFTVGSSSITPTKPSRKVRKKVCTTSGPNAEGNTTTTCVCNEHTEWWSPWLPCTQGVQIGTSSGNEVTWQYTDGNGGSTAAQLLTLKVLSTKNVLPFTGSVGMDDVQNYCWVTPSDGAYLWPDPLTGVEPIDYNGEPGHSAGDYYRHPDKERFRSPSEQASRTNINAGGIIYQEFRGVAGASPPDTIDPILVSSTPVDNAIAVAVDSNIVLTFSEAVDVKTGNIVIIKTSDDSTVEIINVTSDRVTGTGTNRITINPSSDLATDTEYYVQIASTAFEDPSGNSYAGINDKTGLSFTTISSS